jgi:hypothetical protein
VVRGAAPAPAHALLYPSSPPTNALRCPAARLQAGLQAHGQLRVNPDGCQAPPLSPRLAGSRWPQPSTCFRSGPVALDPIGPAILLHNPRSPLTTQQSSPQQPGPRRSGSLDRVPHHHHDSALLLSSMPPCLPRPSAWPPPACLVSVRVPDAVEPSTRQTPAKPDGDPNLLHYLLK